MRASFLACALLTFAFGPVATAQQLSGHVYAGGGPIANSDVSLWGAGQGTPAKLAETQTKDDGAFELKFDSKSATGNAFVEFFGLAKPVKTPVVGGQIRAW